MTQEQIEKHSELMAKFEGLKKSRYGQWTLPENCTSYDVDGIPDSSTEWIITLKYLKDRNWLHRVWEKFRDLKVGKEVDHLHVFFKGKIHNAIGYGTLEEAFLELGKGLEWYYSLNKQS